MLSLDVVRRVGTLDLRVAIDVEPGEVVAVLGPNGAGKTSLMRTVAGYDAIDAGSIRIDGVTVDGVTVDDPAASVFVGPADRSVGYVAQDYLLFVHLSALENVAFGLRARGTSRAEARRVAGEWLERLGIADSAARRPRELSGGQEQRVALARALAPGPRVLLLDEPVAAVDATARAEIRAELRRHLDRFDGMRLLVTHDPHDAAELADRVVVLEGGAVTQRGTLSELAADPASPYVADLLRPPGAPWSPRPPDEPSRHDV